MPNGKVRMNMPGVWHAPSAPAENDLDILEVQIGDSEEEDIERILETAAEFAAEKKKKIQLNH
jgi:ureidoglycolate hydrolase